MGCWQCLFLNVVQLKGKHCQKPHCRNGVVDMFRHRLFSKIKDAQYNRFLGLKILVFSDYFLVGLLNKNKFRCPYYVLWLDNPIKIRSRSQSRRRQKAMSVLIIMIYHIKSQIVFCFFYKKSQMQFYKLYVDTMLGNLNATSYSLTREVFCYWRQCPRARVSKAVGDHNDLLTQTQIRYFFDKNYFWFSAVCKYQSFSNWWFSSFF